MSEMPYDAFIAPSEHGGGGGGAYPAFAQLAGRLLHILPTGREDGVTDKYRPQPHTRLTVDMTFLDGDPIAVVLDKNGEVTAEITPPIAAGQTMTGRWVELGWFVNRLKDRVGQPGYAGMLGVLTRQDTKNGSMWILADPNPQQLAAANAWFAWRNDDIARSRYQPAPPAPAASPFTPQVPAAPAPATPAASAVAPAAPVPPWMR